VGARITITVSAPGFFQKRITFTIRKSKRPKSSARCISTSGKAVSCSSLT
jgi:hypothetical protein